MPLITFKPSEITVDVPEGSGLFEAAKIAGVSIEAPCGGHGICGKCLVKILSGKVDFKNTGMMPVDLLSEGYVLTCKTRVLDEPVSVQVVTQFDKEQGKFSKTSEDMLLISKDLMPSNDDLDFLIKKVSLIVPPPAMGDGLSDFDRLKKAVLAELGCQELEIPFSVLKTLPSVLRDEENENRTNSERGDDGNGNGNGDHVEGMITIAYLEKNGVINIVDIEPLNTTSQNYGIAVDIGTTTIAVQLVYLPEARIIASKTGYNSQIECGLDVISRINYARKPDRLEELRHKVLGTINSMVKELAAAHNVNQRFIYNASIAGNTTMVHLLMGIIPEYIRLEPYTPALYEVPYIKASDLGIDINPNTFVIIAPSVGSYVGGDITSGLLCTSLATNSEDVCLFIDIGTNGELILGNNDFLIGCACSAGPAFEGGGIENGMRASQGAIERTEVAKDTGIAEYSTIGNVPPIGICGSGMISLIANLFQTGWIDAAGKLDRTRPCASIDTSTKNAKYTIAPAESTQNGNPILITEADIDNLIRAKAAIFSACRVMLQQIDMDFEDLTTIYIAGGFGRYLDIHKSTIIGLIPDLPSTKFKFIGNSSIIGAYMTLVSKKHREKQHAIFQKITYLDLSTEHTYMDQYTAALFLPHTDSSLFPNVK